MKKLGLVYWPKFSPHYFLKDSVYVTLIGLRDVTFCWAFKIKDNRNVFHNKSKSINKKCEGQSQLLTIQQFKIWSLFISLYLYFCNWEIIQLYDLNHFKSIQHIWYITWLIALFLLQFRIANRVFSFSQVIRAKWTWQELLHCHQFVRSISFWQINVPLWAKL